MHKELRKPKPTGKRKYTKRDKATDDTPVSATVSVEWDESIKAVAMKILAKDLIKHHFEAINRLLMEL